MIHQENLTKDWIEKISKKHRRADKILVEKVIRALLLLEGLVKQDISFVFKGGTALMLHFDSARRLSIDIDIILPQGTGMKKEWLDALVKEQGFLRWELQERVARSGIHKEHYKFFYTPLHRTNKSEEYVLLDILFEETLYTGTEQLLIQSPFVPQTGKPLPVPIPSIEDLLGDKLTAFAPNTTGIPYAKNGDSMSLEIIKQLYDIGTMFDLAEDLNTIKTTFEKFALAELSYRDNSAATPLDVLDDIFATSLSIATRGSEGGGNFDELQAGIGRIRSFIFSERYHLEKAITHATKAAYLAMLIKHDAAVIEKYESPEVMKEWMIESPGFTRLNKLKKSNPEAFFYWYQMHLLTMKKK